MHPELIYQLALTLVPHIGPVQAKILLQHCNAEEIFHAKKTWLEKIEGIGPVRAASIAAFNDFTPAEEEIKFIEKYRIKPLFITDKDYPKRLLNCYDSPTLLYYKGEADLNAARIVAIIGTRSHTDYAKQVTEKLIKDLVSQNILIISGLAFGVDAIAHKAAVKNELATVGVLAHGLDQIYPPDHAALAKDMIKQKGGLLTEFKSHTKPDKHNFPSRNRIVAGMSDATVVIETGIKGGSMITADLANGYNKDVFAFPGKVTDTKSMGCNYLIRNNKAMLLTDATELLQVMQWEENAKSKKEKKIQRELFIELGADEKTIITILEEKEKVHIDEINLKSGLSSSSIAAGILSLELQNLILSLPGKLYQLA
ncbi:MAG TPA: DNA-processing protein DprA [Chitinophagaceae bacterium]|jgi:DNA processing protein|nr:DNA-processing protein DprA [Chitinophagaceae bacterium]